MAYFQYKARDSDGLAIEGCVESADELSVVKNLRNLGYHVVRIEQQAFSLWRMIQKFFRFRKVSQKEVIHFSRQIATMVKSGLPLTSALSSVAQQMTNEIFVAAIKAILGDVKGGISFSESLSRYPEIFNTLFVNMIKVGETAGILDQVLDRLVALNQQEMDVRMALRSALVYPIILVVCAIAIVTFLLVAIIPKFVVVFETYDARLPLATQILLGMSYILMRLWPIIIMVVAAVIFWFRNYIKTTRGRHQFHKMLLKVPLFGSFYLKVLISRFTRTLGALVKSGVSILEALSVTEKTIDNVVIARVITNVRYAVSGGQSLSETFKVSGFFPSMVVQMLAAGEKSGKMDVMLNDIATYYDQEVEYTLKNVTTILEPVLLLVMGGIVAFIALAVLMPIFNLIKVFKGV